MVVCPRCGEENADRARFCQACGSELQLAAVGREERKLVSALFVDLVGSTAWAERSDPEEVRGALRLYHDRAKAEIEAFGGTVEKFIGDAVVAISGRRSLAATMRSSPYGPGCGSSRRSVS